MKYKDNKRNHVILPGREEALEKFLNQQHNGINHKIGHSFSSNSEDALTWSCFDLISQLNIERKIKALDEILEHSFFEKSENWQLPFIFEQENNIAVEVGKVYNGVPTEETEVDASIETATKIIFIEAKLYSSISLKNRDHNYDQIARKLRVGLEYASRIDREFYFIFLDIAPPKKLYQFTTEKICKENAEKEPTSKWKSAWWYNRYKKGWKGNLRPLSEILTGINLNGKSVESVSQNMGWLLWSDLFKIVLKSQI